MTQKELEKYLWGAATQLRGTIDAGDYKQYIFPLLFFKRICDVYDEEFENAPLYLAEIWACENGEFKFTPYGLWQEKITITDQKGCSEASHGRVYFSEKHGYAGPTEVEFPE